MGRRSPLSRESARGTRTVQDDQAEYSRQMAATRESYQDPKDPVFRRTHPPKGGPDFVTFFPKKDLAKFRAEDSKARRRGPAKGKSARGKGRAGRRRSRVLDETDLPNDASGRSPRSPSPGMGAGGRRASRGDAVVNAPRTPRGRDTRELSGVPFTDRSSLASTERFGSSMRRTRLLPPPMPRGIRAKTAMYGKGVDFRNPKNLYHLVQKEKRATVAARQQKMIKSFTTRFLGTADGGGTGTQSGRSLEGPSIKLQHSRPATGDVTQVAESFLAMSPVDSVGDAHGASINHFPSAPGSAAPELSRSPIRPDETFGAPPSPGFDYTMSQTMPTADDLRVMTAFTGSLAGTLRFGQSKLEKVDIPKRAPQALPGSRGGLSALSTTSLYAPPAGNWHRFATRGMEAVPNHARYGKIKVGCTYAFPVSVRNLGLTPKRFRVSTTTVRADSVPAVLHCRYPAVRLAPGVSEVIEVFCQCHEAGRLWGDVVIVSEFEEFTLPVSAHVLSEPAFEAEREATLAGRGVGPDFARDQDPLLFDQEMAALTSVIPRGGTNVRVQVVVTNDGGERVRTTVDDSDEDMNKAALTVQKSFRGHLGRKRAARVRRTQR